MDLAEINIVPQSEVSPDAALVSGLSPLNITVCCNTRGSITREHVIANSARGFNAVTVIPEHSRIAVVVGGGPSLKANWPELHGYTIRGADVFALNGVAGFLNDRGILPTYQVVVDPREGNVGLLAQARSYLIASQCHPSVFDTVQEDRIGLFHMTGSCLKPDGSSIVDGTLIGGDVTVGLVTLNLAYTLGYREIHLYGYDSSYADGDHHAYEQKQTDQESKILEVFTLHDGKREKFTTNFAMAKQAEMFPKTAAMLCEAGASLTVHGTGLLPSIALSMQKLPLAAE